MNVHIATPINSSDQDCGTTYACMQIMWIQKAVSKPEIQYGKGEDNLISSQYVADEPVQLSRDDLCGQEYGLPAGTGGFFELGYMIRGLLSNLEFDTQYFYQYV